MSIVRKQILFGYLDITWRYLVKEIFGEMPEYPSLLQAEGSHLRSALTTSNHERQRP